MSEPELHDDVVERLRTFRYSLANEDEADVTDAIEEITALREKLAAETARRKFIQYQGRGMGWGISNRSGDSRPFVSVQGNFRRPYSNDHLARVHHDGDVEQAERDALDQAIKAFAAIEAEHAAAAVTRETPE